MDAGGCRCVLLFVSLLFQGMLLRHGTPTAAAEEISIGLILSLGTISGRSSLTTMRMAVDDFYALHNNYTTRILLRPMDSNQDAVDAAAAALDLMKNNKIAAIIGPETTHEAEFVAVLGSAAQTPIISYSASSPFLSVTATQYFIRATVKDSHQSPLIAAIVKYYGWHEVIPIYEDSDYGSGILPSLIDALQSVDARVPNCAGIASSASDESIAAELYRLKTLPTRVFVVHMMPSLTSRLFSIATAAGMVVEGYVWIATDGITNIVDMVSTLDINAKQGVIGVRPHVPSSPELERFTTRWRARFLQENRMTAAPTSTPVSSSSGLTMQRKHLRQHWRGRLRQGFQNSDGLIVAAVATPFIWQLSWEYSKLDRNYTPRC